MKEGRNFKIFRLQLCNLNKLFGCMSFLQKNPQLHVWREIVLENSQFCQRKSWEIPEHLAELTHLQASHRDLSMQNKTNQGCNLDVQSVQGWQKEIAADGICYHRFILFLSWLNIRVDRLLPSESDFGKTGSWKVVEALRSCSKYIPDF